MPDTKIAIEAVGLTKLYGNRRILQDVSFRAAAGKAIALMGANGAGKTSLLRCLAATVRPTRGKVRWFGRPASEVVARSLIGVVAHESLLYPDLTLRENLTFAARMCGVPAPGARAQQWLVSIGLEDRAGSVPSKLSRGMRQRVAVARAAIHNPRILLLDEPFSGLDSQGRQWLLPLLQEFKRSNRTICFSTHDPSLAEALGDQVLVLRAGKLRPAEGAVAVSTAGGRVSARAA